MDVFSWFRQKRQGQRMSGGGTNHEPPLEIVVPFDPAPTVGFAVYFYHGGSDADLPDAARCQAIVEEWLQNAKEPIRAAIVAFLRESFVTFLVRQRGDPVPDPPDEMVRAYNPGETEERRYRNATHIVFVGTTDLAAPPRVGFWAVVAASRALAAHLSGGVIIDPEFPRLLPLQAGELPANGEIRIVQHIVLPYSHDARTGLLWMTTKGMGRFGLPDLEIRDVPPNLAQNLMPVLNGMAQKLMAAAAQHAAPPPDYEDESENEPPMAQGFACPSEVLLSVADIARAYGDGPDENEDSEEGDETHSENATPVRLAVSRQRDGGDALFVRLLPPRPEKNENASEGTPPTGVWLNQMLADLFGTAPNLAAIEKGDADMEAAHDEAVAQLAQVRARFANGFRSGEVLHVKYGFPVGASGTGEPEPDEEDDGHEFMWVAVTSWSEGGRVRGNLANDPQYRHDLRAGQTVEIPEEDIYDWMIVHPDRRIEGAFTNAVLEAMDDEDSASPPAPQ